MRILILTLFSGLTLSTGYSLEEYISEWNPIYIIEQLNVPADHTNPVNLVGNLYGNPDGTPFMLDGAKYKIQDVSGQNLVCFFNSMGLDASKQIELLLSHTNNLSVRWIIGCDIFHAVSYSTEHAEEKLHEDVKTAINYSQYVDDLKEIVALRAKRTACIKYGESLPSSLGEGEINSKENTILRGFLKRCCSVASVRAYIERHISTSEMMTILPSRQTSVEQSYSSIDAIALINQIALFIYTKCDDDLPLEGSNLRLAHKYILRGSTKIARLYYADHHFQAFVPVIEKDDEQDKLLLTVTGSSSER